MKPHTIPATLVEHLRFVRNINVCLLRQLARRRRGQCTWCGQPVAKGRTYYCSEECSDLTYGHCIPSTLAKRVWERDGGKCVICGAVVRLFYNWHAKDAPLAEIDHVVPVVEGGGFCWLDGLRTVCKPCHKIETRKLVARMKTP